MGSAALSCDRIVSLRHFDGNLVVFRPGGLDVGHVGQQPQVFFDPAGQLLQRARGDVAKEHQADHAGAVVHLPEAGTFGRTRKRLDQSNGNQAELGLAFNS